VLCEFNSFFSGYFSSGLNNLLILMVQNLMVVKLLCLSAYLDWVPLPWGARSAMKSASTLIKLFPKRGEKNKDKEEKSGGSPFNILDFLEKPNKDSKEESILSPGALSSSNLVQILAVFIAAFLFKGKIKSPFSNAIVEVEVLKPLTFYQTLLKFFDPSKPRVYILIGSTTVCVYFYFNRGKFSKNKSVLTLAFEFMEKQMNSSLRIIGDSSQFIQGLTLNSLEKLEVVSEKKTEEITFLKGRITTLENERRVDLENRHEVDKAFLTTQNTLGNCRNALTDLQVTVEDIRQRDSHFNAHIPLNKLEGSSDPSILMRQNSEAILKETLTKETLRKFPDYVPQEKSGAGAVIEEKARQNFLKELAKDFFRQAGRRDYYY
jgi:hypothetical protein